MKKESIKLISLINEMIEEIGDLSNIEPLPRRGFNNWEVPGKDEETYKLEMDISPVPLYSKAKYLNKIPPSYDTSEDLYHVSFAIENMDTQFMKTSPKILFRILKTVASEIKKSLSRAEDADSNPILMIGAQSKLGLGKEDPQKLKLYKAIIAKNLPSGYRINSVKNFFDDGYEGILIQKEK